MCKGSQNPAHKIAGKSIITPVLTASLSWGEGKRASKLSQGPQGEGKVVSDSFPQSQMESQNHTFGEKIDETGQ